ncbi:Pre-mRNA-splicing factor of RES complex-domain-containing protein [Fomes fomentarius]|nr:Pre-mRNA-splicing factor of RES complex-domain-containing protein [Fomes fomentarius]
MSLQAYLAEKYMSGPKADMILSKVKSPKKKKRKVATGSSASASTSATTASFVKDDDLTGWADTLHNGDDDGDDIADAVVAEDRRFKKRQRTDADSGWQTVRSGEGEGEGSGSKTPPPAEDEKPQVVATSDEPFKGGLLTSAQLKKKLPTARRPEPKRSASEEAAERAAAQETVYRDAAGRKVDMAAAKAEAARLKREREEDEAKKMEWGKGLVQREQAEKQRKELESMRSKGFGRTADDKELNEELKARELWNDPAAAFLTKKKSKGPRKPEYTGPPPPPNRFGIKPGYRWDGVDRSNGFEKKYFQKQNERRRRGAESYEWSVDDM